ncbi:Aldehyde Dehydrogenase [Desulfitobacterium hafniense DCB-2]|uniref:Aldehyde dehydrogenase n=1 Tax=Desulfitobacterium hafniense (strain DSM 10664 / DCB-2) TaxID=272564 RepID=B8FSK4_DESHD|nr:aldehyde dehydrogenase [Desulfitobacterium hafniense]ACL20215.1 Aldehyde Dehydrogenase [Desulfitobacterium hafniense DCB-2]
MPDIKEILVKQKAFFQTGKTKELQFRVDMLNKLRSAIKIHEEEIMAALKADLNKAPFEAYATEVGMVLEELNYTLKHISSWVKPKRVRTPLVHFPSASYLYTEPYGSVLIMSPWNYPFQLALAPLVGAISAGNCAVLKPSEYSANTSAMIERIVKEIFDESFVAVVRGGREANKTLLNEKFDYIFFTGSVGVGKTVMESAARHLTPVTLELGGKSPCIIDDTADLELAAKRIVWGKFLNAGQTCVAPDYLLVHRTVKEKLIQEIKKSITAFYGHDPLGNEDYPKIINQKHFERLLGLLKSGRVVEGGRSDEKTRRIAPTILDDVTWESPVMQEEIFGPLLPVLEFESFDAALAMVNQHPKPLALYLFTRSKDHEAQAISKTSFGGGCINDTIIHLANPNLRFGGVGESGMGQYHGKGSYDTFSHTKSIMKKSNKLDIPLRYPPFRNHLSLLKKLMK